jgi:hypothetical protein
MGPTVEGMSREVEGEELWGVYHFVKRYFRIDLHDFRPQLILLAV